jgi:hypothetical protein
MATSARAMKKNQIEVLKLSAIKNKPQSLRVR